MEKKPIKIILTMNPNITVIDLRFIQGTLGSLERYIDDVKITQEK